MEKIFQQTFAVVPAIGPDSGDTGAAASTVRASSHAVQPHSQRVARGEGLAVALVRVIAASRPVGAPETPFHINRRGLIERSDFSCLYCAVSLSDEPERLGLINAGALRNRPPLLDGPTVIVWESFAAATRAACRQFGDGHYKICSISAAGLAGVSLNDNLAFNRTGLRHHWWSGIHGRLDEVHLSNDGLVPSMFKEIHTSRARVALGPPVARRLS